MPKYSVTVVPDKTSDSFTKSTCNCASCLAMHLAVLEWDSFTVKTSLQKSMKHVVGKIENRIR